MKFAQSDLDLLPQSYSSADALQSTQSIIREWLTLYSVYQQDTNFVNALKVILRPGKHTAEEIQAIIPTLLAGPQQHSQQAKAGWQNKVVWIVKTLQELLNKQK